MPVRLFPKEHVEQELQNRNCEKVKEYGHTALWRTKTGFHFTVPLEGPDGRCDEYSLEAILKDVEFYS